MKNLFTGQSLQEEKRTFTSITTDHISFEEAGMSTFSPDDIYAKFDRMKEKNSTVKITVRGTPVQDLLDDQVTELRRAATRTLNAIFPPARFMLFDLATKDYKQFEWSISDPLFGSLCEDMQSSGSSSLFENHFVPAGKTREDLGLGDFSTIEAAALVAEEYNLGYTNIKSSDTPEIAQRKNLKNKFITGVQTSLSGCMTWSQGYDFIFNADNVTNGEVEGSLCQIKGTANFEMRFYDQKSPRGSARTLVSKGPPKFNFVPKHPWGSAYAGNRQSTGRPGEFPALNPGGSDNPANNVTAELDVYYNHNTGKAEAGTRQVLAKVLTPISAVKINPMPANFDTQGGFPAPSDTNQSMAFFASGYAIPMTVNKGNPYMFGPVFSKKGTGCDDDSKDKLLVVNRSQKSFPVGRVVMLQRIDDEWIPLDFGDDTVSQFGSIGKWNFQYLISDKDSYFKDDRHYFEEQYNPEMSASVTPNQYEDMFRFSFYDSVAEAIFDTYGTDVANNAGLDAANDPRSEFGIVPLENDTITDPVPTGTPNNGCAEEGDVPEERRVDNVVDAPRIEANNGVYVKTLQSSVPSPCFDGGSIECGPALAALKTAAEGLNAGGDYPAFQAAMKEFAEVLGEDTAHPTGDPTDPRYNGRMLLDAAPAMSNHTINRWPDDGALYKLFTGYAFEECKDLRVTSSYSNQSQIYPDEYWGKLFYQRGQTGSSNYAEGVYGDGSADWLPKKNWFYSVMACLDTKNIGCFFGNNFSMKRRCVQFGPYSAYAKAWATAIVKKFEGTCGAERDGFPQIKTFKWVKGALTKHFVGSRRYLNVTSFDMLSNRWNGHNVADWISLNNPSFDESGGRLEDPSDENFDRYHPFWGALFTEGYTDESVNKLVAKRSNNSTESEVCSNCYTTSLDQSTNGHFGDLYLKRSSRPADGFTGSDDTRDYSYGTTRNNTVLSLDKIYSNGDINMTHLPADIGTNASPSGKYGSPINDFHRMVNLTNVVNPGVVNDPENPTTIEGVNFSADGHIGFDPKRSTETPSEGLASLTVDWSNGKGLKTNKLAINMKTYFARKYYDINGKQFSIQDRQCWAYEVPATLDPQQDENSNELGHKRITEFSFDSTYDLAPMSPKITFMPLTAEWIGAFDSADQVYAQLENRRAYSGVKADNWYNVAYKRLSTPYSSYTDSDHANGTPELKGAGWYWGDETGKESQLDNTTIKRLSHHPLASQYKLQEPTNPSTLIGSTVTAGSDPTVYPIGKEYVQEYEGYGGQRGTQLFRIGRHHDYTISPENSTEDFYDENGDPIMGMESPFDIDFDIDFLEPENEGVAQIDIYNYANINNSFRLSTANPNHGLVGAYQNRNEADTNYVVKLEPGFPFDGYVRHRSNFSDHGILGPRQCWGDDTADCVGVIASRSNMTTASTNLICTTFSSRGLPAYKPEIVGEELGSWGAPANEIQSMGGEHLFARVFETWPDDQTLFDPRYFAIMHFNPGELLTAPLVDQQTDENPAAGFEWEGVVYTRELISETVDYRVPTLIGTGTDARQWEELVQGTTLYANNVSTQGLTAPFDLWKVSTVRRGMLLPFKYALPTVGITMSDIGILVSLPEGTNPAAPQTGSNYKVGDTFTFQGGTGTGAQIRVTSIDGTGGIQDFEIINEGKDFISDDFLESNWENNQLSATFRTPRVIASPDPGVTGTGAFIFAKSGTVIYKDLTDAAPRTGQSTPQRISLTVPSVEDEAIGREEDKMNQVALPLPGADGTFRSYDTFFHYHNDITTVLSYNEYDTVNKGMLKDINKVQFMRLELSTT